MNDRRTIKVGEARFVYGAVSVCVAVAMVIAGWVLRLQAKTDATQAETSANTKWIEERKPVIQSQEKSREAFEKEVLTRVTRTETIVERIEKAVGAAPPHHDHAAQQTAAKDQ